MILRFLRLFPQFRALEAERDILASSRADHDRAVARALDLEARDDSRIQRIMALDSEKDEALRERDELRAALQQESTDKLILQDRLNAAEESVSRLWGMVQDSQNKAYEALKLQVNFATQQKFGITPYPEATHLPPSMEPDLDANMTIPRRMTPSEAVAAQTRRLREQIVERLTTKTA